MDGLRWLLLFFGVLVITGVYLYSRRERSKPEIDTEPLGRVAPTLGEETVDQEVPVPDLAPDVEDGAAESPAADVPQKIVTLRLIARDGAHSKAMS